LLDVAGARNIYEDVATPSAVVTIEDVAKRNPDYVLTTPEAAPRLRQDPKWRAIAAVRQNHLLVYDTTLVGRPSVTLGAAAHSLADLLHPGAVR
jgi:ABC-type Fe3+-hydroxamate transport system substrate-binding protein